jgi:hypothetical protein
VLPPTTIGRHPVLSTIDQKFLRVLIRCFAPPRLDQFLPSAMARSLAFFVCLAAFIGFAHADDAKPRLTMQPISVGYAPADGPASAANGPGDWLVFGVAIGISDNKGLGCHVVRVQGGGESASANAADCIAR